MLRIFGRAFGLCLWFGLFAGAGFAQITTYSYDSLGRVTVVASDLEDDRTYEYDKAGNIDKMNVINNGFSGNAPPVCDDGSVGLSYSQTSTAVNVVSLYCSDANPVDILTLTSVDDPIGAATAVISGNNLVISNVPVGSTSVTYVVSDGNGGSDPAVLIVERDAPFGGGGNPY